ncbi:transcriptional regulator [Paenibacillus swuensis]|uniref:Transcriptional regulator n=1 Tax=Paenibacillus swuensis TaxID=1178515 RepID=A0A172TMS9_9BACL|nr:metalloregulator ArsR/SmtB family transcription factor [Paenibacillus swuensis]ANE48338.1 transcriptional regulator [Paenibacillus swuensis]
MNNIQETSTRRVILNLLKTRGFMTVNGLAKELQITEMAVRRHLNTLERDGLIDSKLIRQAMGRPTQQYALTELAEDLFPKNYHTLTLDLLQELEADEGEGTVARLFERRKDKLFLKYNDRMRDLPLEERVALLTEIQNAGGYMASWSEAEDGGYLLQEHNCPISQVANQFNQACNCELQLFEQLLGTPVERTECLAKGGQKCTYRINAKT